MEPNGQDKKLLFQDQRLEQWRKVWEARCEGKPVYQICKEFDITASNVHNILTDFRKEYLWLIRERIQQEMDMDLDRIDRIIANFTPIANAGKVMVSRMNSQGEMYAAEEWRYCMEAGKVLLQCVKLRSEILGYGENREDKSPESDVWLRRSEEARPVNGSNGTPKPTVKVSTVEDPLDLSFPEFESE